MDRASSGALSELTPSSASLSTLSSTPSDGAGARPAGFLSPQNVAGPMGLGFSLRRAVVGGLAVDFVDASPSIPATDTGLRACPQPGPGLPNIPPVLLLPAFPDGLLGLRRLLPALTRRGLRVIAPVTRGWADWHPKPRAADVEIRDSFYSLRAQIDELAALLAAIGIGKAVVAGHCNSVTLASHFCLVRPDLTAGLVCLSVPYSPPKAIAAVPAPEASLGYRGFLASDAAADFFDADLRTMFRLTLRGGGPAGRRCTDGAQYLPQDRLVTSPLLAPGEEELLVNYVESVGGSTGPLQVYRTEALVQTEFAGVPGDVNAPVLFVSGGWNPLATEGQRAGMRRTCTDLEEVAVPDAGIWIALEAPEEVADAVARWVAARLGPHSRRV
ncbi:Alpha/Beta hydrolase protein [Hyaloraphidium curvatum]|nr:Alpha/Beta hydrolase protein [Hyaloraphidium curvatum]